MKYVKHDEVEYAACLYLIYITSCSRQTSLNASLMEICELYKKISWSGNLYSVLLSNFNVTSSDHQARLSEFTLSVNAHFCWVLLEFVPLQFHIQCINHDKIEFVQSLYCIYIRHTSHPVRFRYPYAGVRVK